MVIPQMMAVSRKSRAASCDGLRKLFQDGFYLVLSRHFIDWKGFSATIWLDFCLEDNKRVCNEPGGLFADTCYKDLILEAIGSMLINTGCLSGKQRSNGNEIIKLAAPGNDRSYYIPALIDWLQRRDAMISGEDYIVRNITYHDREWGIDYERAGTVISLVPWMLVKRCAA